MEIYTANNIKEITKGISGIYRITNIVNGREYYGQAGCFKQRWKIHIKDLNGGYHDNDYLQNDFNKCGVNIYNLTFEIMEICPNIKEILDNVEQTYLDMFWDGKKQCYNIAKIAGASFKGMKHSKTSRNKMSKSRKGKKASEQTKINISNSKKGKKLKHSMKKCKIVYQYDLEGNFIKKHNALYEACAEIKDIYYQNKNIKIPPDRISKCAKNNIDLNKNNKTYFSYNFVWLSEYNGEKIEVKKKTYTEEERKSIGDRSKIANNKPGAQEKFKKRIGSKNPNAKKIKQYDLNGKLIKIWDCIKIAREKYNISEITIYRVYTLKTKSAGGYAWRLIDDEF